MPASSGLAAAASMAMPWCRRLALVNTCTGDWDVSPDAVSARLRTCLAHTAMTDRDGAGIVLVQLPIRPKKIRCEWVRFIVKRGGQMAEFWCELEAPIGPA